MRANTNQLQFIEDFKKNFGIEVISYGCYSNGSIGINFSDSFGDAMVVVYPNGTTEE